MRTLILHFNFTHNTKSNRFQDIQFVTFYWKKQKQKQNKTKQKQNKKQVHKSVYWHLNEGASSSGSLPLDASLPSYFFNNTIFIFYVIELCFYIVFMMEINKFNLIDWIEIQVSWWVCWYHNQFILAISHLFRVFSFVLFFVFLGVGLCGLYVGINLRINLSMKHNMRKIPL